MGEKRNEEWLQWIAPERFNDIDLQRIVTFFVFHSPCKELSAMSKTLDEYGWKKPWQKPYWLNKQLIQASTNYNFTKCFMGTNGISLTAGFTTPDVNEAKVKAAAIESSREVFVLADHSKFDEVSSATFAGLGKAVIITDMIPNRKYKEAADITEVGQ